MYHLCLLPFCYCFVFSKKGVACASVAATNSPVIMAKAKAHDVPKCAEEEPPTCSTLLPRLESVQEKKPMSCQTQMCALVLSLLNEFMSSLLI